jgi:hypothetical protein
MRAVRPPVAWSIGPSAVGKRSLAINDAPLLGLELDALVHQFVDPSRDLGPGSRSSAIRLTDGTSADQALVLEKLEAMHGTPVILASDCNNSATSTGLDREDLVALREACCAGIQLDVRTCATHPPIAAKISRRCGRCCRQVAWNWTTPRVSRLVQDANPAQRPVDDLGLADHILLGDEGIDGWIRWRVHPLV